MAAIGRGDAPDGGGHGDGSPDAPAFPRQITAALLGQKPYSLPVIGL